MLLQRIWSQFKIWCFFEKIATAGSKKVDEFLSHFMSIFNLHITGQCLKNVTGFAQIFVCEIKIYLFGSYLCFKSVYKFLI
ncbi:hypothetical protein CVS44_10925 [Staphylococcus haemolyticus]|nr:hypothetical protein CVS44_10925 [Staphylococcus haemolyticus]PTU81437.1 hypothetical protein BUZ66_10415 [Staphylococcus pasteuri]RIO33835.1 hypothetical protein BUZ65_10485 [Staphylococcus pasteuri]